ncbi:MAG: hypothetical protein LRZ84_22855 [Desertifilum sp.]|nr:hypothetical protein [Desertifilum sp.]
MKIELPPLELYQTHKFAIGQTVSVEKREHLGAGVIYGVCLRDDSCPACRLGWWYFVKFPEVDGLNYYPEKAINYL